LGSSFRNQVRITTFAFIALFYLSLSGCKGLAGETQVQPSPEMKSTTTPSPTPTSVRLPNLEVEAIGIQILTADECDETAKIEYSVNIEIANSGDAHVGIFHVLINEQREQAVSEVGMGESVTVEFTTTAMRIQVLVDNRDEVTELDETDNFTEMDVPAPSQEVCPSVPEVKPSPESVIIPYLPGNVEINILQIRMFNEKEGWAIGEREEGVEHILQTKNGGRTWQDVSPPEPIVENDSPFLRATAFFMDLENAWVTYQSDPHGQPGAVWHTQNSGLSWEPGLSRTDGISGSASSWAKLEFVDENHGWLLVDHFVGAHTYQAELYQTLDGGVTWQLIQNDQANQWMAGSTAGIDFIDTTNGMITSTNLATGGVFTYRTTDGGATWVEHELSSPDTNSDLFNLLTCGIGYPSLASREEGILSVFCYNEEGVSASYLYGTLDTGYTWKAYPFPGEFRGVAFDVVRPDLIFILGRYEPESSSDTSEETAELYRSIDRGKSWEQVSIVHWYGSIHFIDGQFGWAIARLEVGNMLLFTSNSGLTWERLQPLTALDDGV